MRINHIACPPDIVDKLESKHDVALREVRQVLLCRPRVRFAEEGYVEGEDVYAALGQTRGGRYLVVFFVYKPGSETAIVISARDMTDKEKRAYGRK